MGFDVIELWKHLKESVTEDDVKKSLTENKIEPVIKKIKKRRVPTLEERRRLMEAYPESPRIFAFLSDHWGEFIDREDAINNLVRVFDISKEDAEDYVKAAESVYGRIQPLYAEPVAAEGKIPDITKTGDTQKTIQDLLEAKYEIIGDRPTRVDGIAYVPEGTAGRVYGDLVKHIPPSGTVPEVYRSYRDKIETLEGREFKFRYEGDSKKRVLLYYPEPEYDEEGKEIIGLSIETKYVQIKKEYGEENENIEEQKYDVIARGISEKEVADRIAREKGGIVVQDESDENKFMVIKKISEARGEGQEIEEDLERVDGRAFVPEGTAKKVLQDKLDALQKELRSGHRVKHLLSQSDPIGLDEVSKIERMEGNEYDYKESVDGEYVFLKPREGAKFSEWVGVPKKYVEIRSIEEARGEGQGVGGPRQGDGGADLCKCPQCGKIFEKEKGVPCRTKTCPDCGVELIGIDVKEEKLEEGYVRKKKVVEVSKVYRGLGAGDYSFDIPDDQAPYDAKAGDKIGAVSVDLEEFIRILLANGYSEEEIESVLDELRTKDEIGRVDLPKPVKVEVDYFEWEPGSDNVGESKELKDEIMAWLENIAQNYNDETDTDLRSQIVKMAETLGLDITWDDIDKRWQYFTPGDEVTAEDLYRELVEPILVDKGIKEGLSPEEREYVSPLGGGLYVVSFPPTEIEKILGFKHGKTYHIKASSEEEALQKAKRLYAKDKSKGKKKVKEEKIEEERKLVWVNDPDLPEDYGMVLGIVIGEDDKTYDVRVSGLKVLKVNKEDVIPLEESEVKEDIVPITEPPAALQALAKKANKSLKDAERYYKEAKKGYLKRTGKKESELTGKDFQYIMGVVKKRLGLKTKPIKDSVLESLKKEITSVIDKSIEEKDFQKMIDAFSDLTDLYEQISEDTELINVLQKIREDIKAVSEKKDEELLESAVKLIQSTLELLEKADDIGAGEVILRNIRNKDLAEYIAQQKGGIVLPDDLNPGKWKVVKKSKVNEGFYSDLSIEIQDLLNQSKSEEEVVNYVKEKYPFVKEDDVKNYIKFLKENPEVMGESKEQKEEEVKEEKEINEDVSDYINNLIMKSIDADEDKKEIIKSIKQESKDKEEFKKGLMEYIRGWMLKGLEGLQKEMMELSLEDVDWDALVDRYWSEA